MKMLGTKIAWFFCLLIALLHNIRLNHPIGGLASHLRSLQMLQVRFKSLRPLRFFRRVHASTYLLRLTFLSPELLGQTILSKRKQLIGSLSIWYLFHGGGCNLVEDLVGNGGLNKCWFIRAFLNVNSLLIRCFLEKVKGDYGCPCWNTATWRAQENIHWYLYCCINTFLSVERLFLLSASTTTLILAVASRWAYPCFIGTSLPNEAYNFSKSKEKYQPGGRQQVSREIWLAVWLCGW